MTVRTTVTLDDDVAAKLQAETRQSGRPFQQALNDALRRGLDTMRRAPRAERFRVSARDLGRVSPGLNLDNIGDLLETVEGPRSQSSMAQCSSRQTAISTALRD